MDRNILEDNHGGSEISTYLYKSDGKCRNTLGHLDQYKAQIVNQPDTSAPPPTNGFHMPRGPRFHSRK